MTAIEASLQSMDEEIGFRPWGIPRRVGSMVAHSIVAIWPRLAHGGFYVTLCDCAFSLECCDSRTTDIRKARPTLGNLRCDPKLAHQGRLRWDRLGPTRIIHEPYARWATGRHILAYGRRPVEYMQRTLARRGQCSNSSFGIKAPVHQVIMQPPPQAKCHAQSA
ncbi:hypothetical protein FA13DRAFT_1729685 [Coprinellus micaceus]|uniref:Uncharacterized protein n=1 Tax=Coprinellus micaceus TaxID=71717 RepID=A0A4Y7TJ48_COPMI|nr:hypothetical protein FA13DRAFT_1729685 [Coprinellus micaceus]